MTSSEEDKEPTEPVGRFAGAAERVRIALASPSVRPEARDALLAQLLNEGKADIDGSDIVLPPGIMVCLTPSEQRVLDLPERYPFGVRISVSGIL